MAMGPGKYVDLATAARLSAEAEGVILLIFGGRLGEGFEVQATLPLTLRLPEILRTIADQIEAMHSRGKL
jgi:hypothetical protein